MLKKLMLLIMSFLFFSFAHALAQEALSNAQKDEIRTLIRDYILQNPEIIAEAIAILDTRHQAEQEIARKSAMVSLQQRLLYSDNQIVLGNPNGDVTIVEFFDYNCGFCKQAHKTMVRLLEQDPNLRFVLKEFPVLGPDSIEAARVSTAVYQLAPDSFEDFHMQLLLNPGQANKAKALHIAEKLKLDIQSIQKSIQTENVAITIQENYELAEAIGINGTPSYILGEELIFGDIGVEQLKQIITQLRINNKEQADSNSIAKDQ